MEQKSNAKFADFHWVSLTATTPALKIVTVIYASNASTKDNSTKLPLTKFAATSVNVILRTDGLS